MSENNMVTVEGVVQKKISGKGSKSEHVGFYLVTKDKQFLLRKRDENPFQQTSLKRFDGKMVRCEGVVDEYVFFVSEIKEI